VVQGVILQDGKPHILVNGVPYNLSQVVAVVPTVIDPTSPVPGSASQ